MKRTTKPELDVLRRRLTTRRFALAIPLLLAAGACTSARSDSPPITVGKDPNPSPQPEFGDPVQLDEAPPPISGGTLAASRTAGVAVAADSDRDRVYVVDVEARTVRHTVQLAHRSEPGRVALDNANRAHVALRGTGELATIDLATGQVTLRAACTSPRGVTFDPDVGAIIVACATGDIVSFPPAGGSATSRASAGRDLRDIHLRNGKMVLTRFRTAKTLEIRRGLDTSAGSLIEAESALGESNLAWRAVAAPDPTTSEAGTERTAVVTQDPSVEPVRVEAGGYGSTSSGLQGFGCESNVGIVSTRLHLLGGSSGSVRLPNAVLPVDLATNGREFVVVAAGNAHTPSLPQLFVVHDDQLRVGPQECVSTVKGTVPGEAIAAAFDQRDQLLVQTREPAALHIMSDDRRRSVKSIVLATDSRKDTGHAIFHSNAGGNIACASCHAEGADDARTWEFVGMGPRRTPSLLGTTPHTEPFHWSGDMKDLSTLVDHVFVERMSGPKIDKKQVDNLGHFLFTLPAPAKLRVEAEVPVRGKELFDKRCVSCHTGSIMTNNQSVDVGTGGVFQVPSLVGVAWRAPYLHSGCAITLFDRFDPKCGSLTHGDTRDLSKEQIADIVAYLETL